MGNVYILLLIFLYLLIKNLYSKYFTEEYKNLKENIFVNNNARFKDYNILTLTRSKKEVPSLLTNYRFSEEYKLGFELSKIHGLKIKITEGMYDSIEKILKQGGLHQLCFCTENDIFEYFNKNGYDDNLRIICSFFRKEMIFLINSKFRVNTIQGIKNIIKRNKVTNKTIKLGILAKGHSSHNDALKVLNCMSIDENTRGIQIKKYSNMRELIYNFDKDNIDFIYLTTTSKNKFIIELLKKKFVNVIGIGGISDSLIRSNFDMVFKNIINTNKYNRIVKSDDNLFSYNSTSNIGKNFNIKTYSTRLFLVCRKELSNDYVFNLTNSIFKNRKIIKQNMNDYFLTNMNNILDKNMEPFEMFFINEKMKYHDGAHKFFKRIGFISNNKNMSLFNKKIKSKLLLENYTPYQKLFTRK